MHPSRCNKTPPSIVIVMGKSAPSWSGNAVKGRVEICVSKYYPTLTERHGERYAAELPPSGGGSCLLLCDRRKVLRGAGGFSKSRPADPSAFLQEGKFVARGRHLFWDAAAARRQVPLIDSLITYLITLLDYLLDYGVEKSQCFQRFADFKVTMKSTKGDHEIHEG